MQNEQNTVDKDGMKVDVSTFKGSVFHPGDGVPCNKVVPISKETPEGLYPPLSGG